jgi:hypothetical protein
MGLGTRLNGLGFWNRLALVAAAIVVLIYPQKWLIDRNDLTRDRANAWYQGCTQTTPAPTPVTPNAWARCRNERDQILERDREAATEEWSIVFSMTIVLCAITYGLIWLVAAVIKWIWAGRRANTN